ncbi:toll/interleukin-1 receptor domain-containing protein [Streptomyces tagetis]|uniref:Toll/interleukin-1 receptor domain-containing protein n=1 Tax=Streptomyces tagetis TaxID=2820809 RepID=A0A940XHQ2_9ACTN|nr:toll/interleukin-1 receptor domain-containing protein [Streptomyces sp. RG38]MBQ0827387.1 toll/interleukin-1 receptor domain-containing protein [Streptomyces sp. RG38]
MRPVELTSINQRTDRKQETAIKLFLSWSGERSREAAETLRSWLPDVLQYINPWLSSVDISAGRRGVREITDELSETDFGIICVTPENQSSTWINFEAGALSKQVNGGYVVPFLIGMKTTDLISPLSQFQAIIGDSKGDVQKLLFDINSASGDPAISRERLERSLQKNWPEFESKMRTITAASLRDDGSNTVHRSEADKTEEILLIARQLDHRMAEIERYTLRDDETPRRPSREIRRISEEKFIASSFAKIGWEAIRSSWEGNIVINVAQRSGESSQPISRDFVERLAKSLGREVVVLGETGKVIVRSNLS